jgi:hypothetical protein
MKSECLFDCSIHIFFSATEPREADNFVTQSNLLFFRRRLIARARRKLEQTLRPGASGLAALLTDQPSRQIVPSCRRHMLQGA